MKKLITALIFLLPMAVIAEQQSIKIGLSVWSGYPESVKGFKKGLEKYGYFEGKNVSFIYRNANGDKQTQQSIAKELLNEDVDMVYSLTTPGTVIIKETLPAETPIVFSIVTYPADSGLIEAFDYSGNNLVGTSNFIQLHHYVELLKIALPKAKTLAIFHRKGEPNSKIQAVNLIRLFKRQGIMVHDFEPSSIAETVEMAKTVVGKVDAFITTTDTLMQGGGERALIELSQQHSIPILSSNKSGIEQGSTFGPVADFYTLGMMSGDMAGKILSGNVQPYNLTSQYQSPPTFLVNKQRLNKLGIVLPESFSGLVYVN